jgi:hypothetical protein
VKTRKRRRKARRRDVGNALVKSSPRHARVGGRASEREVPAA